MVCLICYSAARCTKTVMTVSHIPGGEEVTLPAILPVMAGTPGSTKWAGPALGYHTNEVLREQLKLDDDTLAKLRQKKVI